VTFEIKDTNTGGSYSRSDWGVTVPGVTIIYLTVAFSPASAIEGITTNSQLTNVPYFSTYVGYGETIHYHGTSGTVPAGITTKIYTAVSNYYYWAMASTYDYSVSSIIAYGTYGPGSGLTYPNNLVGTADS
jgi:hypothetical protein